MTRSASLASAASAGAGRAPRDAADGALFTVLAAEEVASYGYGVRWGGT